MVSKLPGHQSGYVYLYLKPKKWTQAFIVFWQSIDDQLNSQSLTPRTVGIGKGALGQSTGQRSNRQSSSVQVVRMSNPGQKYKIYL